MRRTLLALSALGCLAMAGATAAHAAPATAPEVRPTVRTVQYWHHRHFWHHRHWHHGRWCYYHPGAC